MKGLRAALSLLALAGGTEAAPFPSPIRVHADHNPILARGDYYSTDPAPLVAGDTLYILTGRDEAPVGGDDFIMNEWRCLRAVLEASTDGRTSAGLAVEEWEALALGPEPVRVYRGFAASSATCAAP